MNIQTNFLLASCICFTSTDMGWLVLNWTHWNAPLASLWLICTLLKHLRWRPFSLIFRERTLLYLLKTQKNPEDCRYPVDSSIARQAVCRQIMESGMCYWRGGPQCVLVPVAVPKLYGAAKATPAAGWASCSRMSWCTAQGKAGGLGRSMLNHHSWAEKSLGTRNH